jgi:hypothetical protein
MRGLLPQDAVDYALDDDLKLLLVNAQRIKNVALL